MTRFEHKPECALLEEPWYMFDTKCTCRCADCASDPYTCPQGRALVAAIHERKKHAALDAISDLGSDEIPFRKLGK